MGDDTLIHFQLGANDFFDEDGLLMNAIECTQNVMEHFLARQSLSRDPVPVADAGNGLKAIGDESMIRKSRHAFADEAREAPLVLGDAFLNVWEEVSGEEPGVAIFRQHCTEREAEHSTAWDRYILPEGGGLVLLVNLAEHFTKSNEAWFVPDVANDRGDLRAVDCVGIVVRQQHRDERMRG